nr:MULTISPECIES: thiamine ABC transporter substrate binding subunit [unclassified Enterobacter]
MPVFAKPVLTVYTYDSFAADWGPGPAVKKAFEADCNCELKFVALEDGVSLLNRVRMEGKNSKADVVLGLDNNLVEAATQTKLFAPSNIESGVLQVPGGWKNSTFVPYDYGYFAFVYDKNKLKNPPKSLKELVESDQKWKVIYEDPRTSTPGLGLLLWMQKVYGNKAPEAWQKLAKKTVTVTKGWSEAYGLFLKGEADLVLSYTTSPAYHIIEEKKDNYAAANFSEGHYLQVEVAGRLANSKQPELAEKFIKFITTPGFQNTIATGNWMYPVTNVALPAGFDSLVKPQTTLEFLPQQVATQRAEWINEWQRAVSR